MNEGGCRRQKTAAFLSAGRFAFDETVFRKQMKELERAAENECLDICEMVKENGAGISATKEKRSMTDLHIHILPGG